jgi:hypothetical protein
VKLAGKNSALALILVAGCNAGDVSPGDVHKDTDTDGGYGDSGDTGEVIPHECWAEHAPAGAVRWQCEGLAEATVFFDLDVQIPDWIEGADLLQAIIDHGRLDGAMLFGPWSGEAYDDPGVDACCSPSIGGNDAKVGLDDTGADDADDAIIPQAARACTDDCADQACRSIPPALRELAGQLPAGVPVLGPSYRQQLKSLANWVASHQQECWDAMVADGVSESYGGYVVDGAWQIPDDANEWPALTGLSIRGKCTVYDWHLPEVGEPLACTGLNDNNEEVPSGNAGSLGGFDTFAPTTGQLRLDGPTVFGVPATGSAPILGIGDVCARGECSRLDAWVGRDALELRRLLLVAPSSMSWERDGMRLTVDGLHAMVEHPLSIPLEPHGDVMRFEIPAGKLEVLFAGQLYGVPMKVVVPNTTPVTGTVFPLFDGSHGIVIDPFAVEHRDAYGTWTMHVELGELVAFEHAPRASFEVQTDGTTRTLDASASFDLDGDALTYEWYRDGMLVAEGPVVQDATADASPPVLVVTDDGGRSSSSNGLAADGG